jgi:hypothetical protein
MTEQKDSKNPTDTEDRQKKTLTLSKKLELKKVVEKDQVRQSFSHGRSKTVEVEVKRKRVPLGEKLTDKSPTDQQAFAESSDQGALNRLTHGELETRFKAVQEALRTNVSDQDAPPPLEEVRAKEEPSEIEETSPIAETPVSISEEDKPVAVAVPEKPRTTTPKTQEIKKKPHEQAAPIILRASSYGPSKTSLTKPIPPIEVPIEDLPQKPHHPQSAKNDKNIDLEDEGIAQRKAARGGVESKSHSGLFVKALRLPENFTEMF